MPVGPDGRDFFRAMTTTCTGRAAHASCRSCASDFVIDAYQVYEPGNWRRLHTVIVAALVDAALADLSAWLWTWVMECCGSARH